MSCVLGFDVGTRLTGVAVGNYLTATARPLTTVNVREGKPDWDRIDNLMTDWQPEALVVGLPLQMDGSEQAMSRVARHFAKCLEKRYVLPVYLSDERNSSQEAARRFAAARAAGLRRRRDAVDIDAHAAAVILESWLQMQSPR
jgi:putative Holliday junction resolvase